MCKKCTSAIVNPKPGATSIIIRKQRRRRSIRGDCTPLLPPDTAGRSRLCLTSTAEPSRGPAVSPFARREQPIEHAARETRSKCLDYPKTQRFANLEPRHCDRPRSNARFRQHRHTVGGVNVSCRQFYVGRGTRGPDPSSLEKYSRSAGNTDIDGGSALEHPTPVAVLHAPPIPTHDVADAALTPNADCGLPRAARATAARGHRPKMVG